MMRGHLNTTSSTVSTVTVSGLANATYDVYVYVDGDNGSASRTAAYRISGAGISPTTVNLTDAANTNFSGSFVQASGSNGNYVEVQVAASRLHRDRDARRLRHPEGAKLMVSRLLVISGLGGSDLARRRNCPSRRQDPYNINTTALNGFAGSAALTVSGLPPGATGSVLRADLHLGFW